jgi:hypothetical protein
MSEQRSPDTKGQYLYDTAVKRRKASRDKAAKPVAEDYADGDLIMVEAREGNGFVCYALAAVEDVIDFPPMRRWTHTFNLVVRIMMVDRVKYEPAIGHLWTVDTEIDSGYNFGRQWSLSRLPMNEFVPFTRSRS